MGYVVLVPSKSGQRKALLEWLSLLAGVSPGAVPDNNLVEPRPCAA